VKKPFGVDGAVPTFIIESRSMSQSRGTMLETMDDWMKGGVMEAWLVDPIVVDFDRLRTGRADDVLPTFGTVDIYVRNPTTGSYTVETLANRPKSVRSSTALPGFVMDFQKIWSEAMTSPYRQQ
jgi:Uma2 family endonuclease